MCPFKCNSALIRWSMAGDYIIVIVVKRQACKSKYDFMKSTPIRSNATQHNCFTITHNFSVAWSLFPLWWDYGCKIFWWRTTHTLSGSMCQEPPAPWKLERNSFYIFHRINNNFVSSRISVISVCLINRYATLLMLLMLLLPLISSISWYRRNANVNVIHSTHTPVKLLLIFNQLLILYA